jgi:hypothetical protein
MAVAGRRTVRESTEAAIDRWVDERLAELPPLTDEQRHAAVAIFATAKPRRTDAA